MPILQDMYEHGARFFWVHNTGPFGCLAYVLERVPIGSGDLDKAGCAKPYNKVAQYFNNKLKKALFSLRKQLPKAAITYVDVYTVKYSLISQARQYGKPLISYPPITFWESIFWGISFSNYLVLCCEPFYG